MQRYEKELNKYLQTEILYQSDIIIHVLLVLLPAETIQKYQSINSHDDEKLSSSTHHYDVYAIGSLT